MTTTIKRSQSNSTSEIRKGNHHPKKASPKFEKQLSYFKISTKPFETGKYQKIFKRAINAVKKQLVVEYQFDDVYPICD